MYTIIFDVLSVTYVICILKSEQYDKIKNKSRKSLNCSIKRSVINMVGSSLIETLNY